ncbi:Chromo (CHRromatin Organization MOdifier) domain [Carpediemonas membranifera]|nr:Chromo (CHRromatin Organization MOdifier) domain [Carpediemonas membranifera]|eukprot:KAG9393501.1 Chromo (CHRromatin Organization MOdifier) domain [Carpediemonas membranifera]
MEGKGEHPNTYRVRDLVTRCVSTVHADRLVRFETDLSDTELERIAAFEQGEQPVKEIVGHKKKKNGSLELLIRWEGLTPDEDSYVPYNRYYDQLAALDDYLVAHPEHEAAFAAAKKKFRSSGRR